MKIEDANARLGQDMREAQAQGDTDAVAIIATAMLIYDVPMNLDQFISEIEQQINQHPASEKSLSFALALSYTKKKDRRQELYMSDGTANPLISVLETIIETDHILRLPNLPEEFVREIQAEQQQAIKIVTDFTQKEAPHMPPHFLASLHSEPGKQARKLLAMLKPMLEQPGESTPKVSKVEDLPAPTEQKSSQPEQPVASDVYQPPVDLHPYQPPADAPPRWLNLVDAMMYPLEHPSRLTNIIIGGVLVLVPIVGWLLIIGYMIDVARRVIVGDTSSPEWADWGTKFKEGFTASLLAFIWLVILIVPALILPFLVILAILAFFFLMPAFMGRYIAKGHFGAGFEMGEIRNMFARNFGSYLRNWFLAIVFAGIAFAILRAADLITFGLVLIFTTFYYSLFLAHLLGQLYRILDREHGVETLG